MKCLSTLCVEGIGISALAFTLQVSCMGDLESSRFRKVPYYDYHYYYMLQQSYLHYCYEYMHFPSGVALESCLMLQAYGCEYRGPEARAVCRQVIRKVVIGRIATVLSSPRLFVMNLNYVITRRVYSK